MDRRRDKQTARQKPKEPQHPRSSRLASLITIVGVAFQAEPHRNIFSTGIDLREGNLRRDRKEHATEPLTDNIGVWTANKCGSERCWLCFGSSNIAVPWTKASTSARADWTTASSGHFASPPAQSRWTTLVSVYPRTWECFRRRTQGKITGNNLCSSISNYIYIYNLLNICFYTYK